MESKQDEGEVLRQAEAAGLQKALAQYRREVLAAAKAAAEARGAFTPSADAAVEPWPPMRVGGPA